MREANVMVIGLFVIGVFLQLLCLRSKKVLVRLVPTITVLLHILLLWVTFAVGNGGNWAVLILMLFLCAELVGSALCWAVYGIVSHVRKRG